MSITPSMVFDLAVSVLNFGIMFILFRLVVIEPMFEAVALREKRVVDQLAEVDEIMTEAEELQSRYQARMNTLEDELAEIQSLQNNTLERSKNRILDKTETEVAHIIEKAELEAENIMRQMRAEMSQRVAGDAVAKARELLEKTINKKTQDKILYRAVDQVGELHAS